MQDFAALLESLLDATAPGAAVAAAARHLQQADPADAAWAVYLLMGGRAAPRLSKDVLRQAIGRAAGLQDWLVQASEEAVGDLAETAAHLLPTAVDAPPAPGLAAWMQQQVLPLRGLPVQQQVQQLAAAFQSLPPAGRLLLARLVGSGLRGVLSPRLLRQALAQASGLPEPLLALRLAQSIGSRGLPDAASWAALTAPASSAAADRGQPCPWQWPQALPAGPEALGPVADWLLQWQPTGPRAQVVKRAGQVWIWSGAGELLTAQHPQVATLAAALSDGTVLDGHLLVPAREGPAPTLSPSAFMAFDLLEWAGADLRQQDQAQRLQRLAQALQAGPFALSPALPALSWADADGWRQRARAHAAQGLVLRHRSSPHGQGGCWNWAAEPLRLCAVLSQVRHGAGARIGPDTEFGLTLWNREPAHAQEAQAVLQAIAGHEPPVPGALRLLPVAQARATLGSEEAQWVERALQDHVVQKFGPVRSLLPTLLVDLAFDGADPSRRHQCGLVLRGVRILRVVQGQPLHQADHLGRLRARLDPSSPQ